MLVLETVIPYIVTLNSRFQVYQVHKAINKLLIARREYTITSFQLSSRIVTFNALIQIY